MHDTINNNSELKERAAYVFKSRQQNVNNFDAFYDLKLYAEEKSQINSLVDKVYTCIIEMRMASGLKKKVWYVKLKER